MTAKSYRGIAIAQAATALGTIGFWIAFFTVGLAPENPPPGYFAFEHSFPPPDLLLSAGLLTAAWLLSAADEARQRLGGSISLVCAGGLLFLGVIDVSFNLQHGMYAISLADTLLALAINSWCVVFGAFLIVRFR